jgi:uncharacterized protein YhaN
MRPGKSTLMAFIRAMFFGFDKRGTAKRYEPLNGGSHGGSLELLVGDTRLRLERLPWPPCPRLGHRLCWRRGE